MIAKIKKMLLAPAGVAALLGIWLLALRNAFGGERLFSLYEDNEFLTGAIFSRISEMYLNGVFPLRVEAILAGFPLYNSTQFTPFYPFYAFFLDIYHDYWSTVHALHWLTLLHLLVMLINTNFLLRTIGANRISSIVGAALFTFSANMYQYSIWVNIVAPYAWLPLYVAGLLGILKGEAPRRNLVVIVVSLMMIVLASPAQPLIHAVFITVFVCFGYVAYFARARTSRQLVVPLLHLGIASLIAFLICSPIVLSAMADAGSMIRWIGNFPAISANQSIPFDAFVYYKLPLGDVWQIVVNTQSGIVGSPYLGFFVIPLAALAFLYKRNWLAIVFLALSIYSLLSAFGDDLGLAYVNHEVPLLNRIREPGRFLVLFQLGMAVLAALGLTNLARAVGDAEHRRKRLGVLLSAASVIVVALFVFAHQQAKLTTPDIIRFLACAALIGLTFFAFVANSAGFRKAMVLAWSTAAIAGLFSAVSWVPPLKISQSLYVNNDYSSLDRAIAYIAAIDPNSNYRLFVEGRVDSRAAFDTRYASMLASYRGVRTFDAYVIPAPRAQSVDFSYAYSPYYSYQGAAFLICKGCGASSHPSLKALKTFGDYRVFFDASAYPRIFIGRAIGYFASASDFIKPIPQFETAPGLDRVVYLENGSAALSAPGDPEKSCNFLPLASSATRYDLSVDCEAGQVIVLNEFHDGNWVGYVNGERVDVLKVNGNQNGIVLAAKSQFVSFRYRPSLFLNSLYLSLLGLVLLAAAVLALPGQSTLFKKESP